MPEGKAGFFHPLSSLGDAFLECHAIVSAAEIIKAPDGCLE
jgi:hypothetical protein